MTPAFHDWPQAKLRASCWHAKRCAAINHKMREKFFPAGKGLVYDDADIICLSLDKDRISWSGRPYAFDTAGFQQLVPASILKKRSK